YSDDTPYVINGMNFIVNKGESVGIMGKSGCGKSTLIRLLLGFEHASEGSIYIDGFDIRELDLQHLRKKIGTVIQGSGLISGDIYSNIIMTKPDATREEVVEVIELSGLKQDIDNLPMGVRTPVNNENCTLSGGQKQRILIARALINKPEVLIFDEATSALDNVSQLKITQSVNALKCTKIIIAHRLSTIEHCDRVFVMDKGKITAEGTFDELKQHNSYLMKNMKRQII
ncbi:MAG: ATP-binding cassette domain-containing protein, partial [Oscillospiraceae bacterium]